jgi:anhydro-N-acetylmuramic acid kinase
VIAVGLMSGTSLDGVDAALVRIVPRAKSYDVELLRFATTPYEPRLRDELLAALPPNAGSTAAVARLHHAVGGAFAAAALAVAGEERPVFVASHGQTLWHAGAAGATLQVGDPFVIREAIGATVCADFRSADCAAGGQGAPLVARIDALLLADSKEDRVALNLGGIANVTLLRKGAPPDAAIAFDTGPANVLLDAFVAARTGGRMQFDAGGELARRGRVAEDLLAAMLADDYFVALPPKSTGRERFGAHFLEKHAGHLANMSTEDGAATLAELTAASVAGAIRSTGMNSARVIVSGGGAHNRALLDRLAHRLEPAVVEPSGAYGLPVDAKEAIAFAVLGYETLRERAANVPAATGARRAVVLGAIAPHDLRRLLAEVDRECSNSS